MRSDFLLLLQYSEGNTCLTIVQKMLIFSFSGVPLPLIGMVSYGLVTLLSLQQSGKKLLSGFGESDVRFLLLGTTTSMATASAYFLYLLAEKLSGTSCSYCLVSAFLSFILLFVTLKVWYWNLYLLKTTPLLSSLFSTWSMKQDNALEEIQKVAGLQLAIAAIVVAILSNSYTMASAKFPG